MMSGWETLNAAIAAARAAVEAEAPDEATAAEGEAYVARVVTAALSTAFMSHRHVQGGLATALPAYGGPNPDYIMRHAIIDPAQRYRLDGNLNGSERAAVGLYTIGPNGAPLLAGHTAFDHANCTQGAFSLEIAADAKRPGGLAIPPGARILMVRVLHRDAAQPALLNLVGAQAARGASLATGSTEGALAQVAKSVGANINEYLKWMAAARDLPNRLANAPATLAETVVGDADTLYFLGGFDLNQGEWLEVIMPAGVSGYWSLHAYNFWYEHLETPGVHDRNAVASSDGHIRIAIGPYAPRDAPNRIDTLGRHRGALICRIIGSGICPETHVHRHSGG